jgi:hypothetical protein
VDYGIMTQNSTVPLRTVQIAHNSSNRLRDWRPELNLPAIVAA